MSWGFAAGREPWRCGAGGADLPGRVVRHTRPGRSFGSGPGEGSRVLSVPRRSAVRLRGQPGGMRLLGGWDVGSDGCGRIGELVEGTEAEPQAEYVRGGQKDPGDGAVRCGATQPVAGAHSLT